MTNEEIAVCLYCIGRWSMVNGQNLKYNSMPFKFEKLEIWKLALDYANDIHLLTRKFPKEEKLGLSSQFKRTADSISLNIAEGSIGQSDPEQKKFISYSIRSVAECVNCLYLSIGRGYIGQVEFDTFYKRAEKLMAKTTKFRNRIN